MVRDKVQDKVKFCAFRNSLSFLFRKLRNIKRSNFVANFIINFVDHQVRKPDITRDKVWGCLFHEFMTLQMFESEGEAV